MPGIVPGPLNRLRGQKQPFSLEQAQQLDELLRSNDQYRDRAILWLGIDSFLRGSDLLMLQVCDVQSITGDIRTQFHIKQHKTNEGVCIALSQTARHAVHDWIIESGKSGSDFLFTRTATSESPLSTSALRRLVKRWAHSLGLQVELFAAHSLRRTKAAFLYSQGVRIEYLQILLGHSDLKNTTRYLGIEQRHALDIAACCDLRTTSRSPS